MTSIHTSDDRDNTNENIDIAAIKKELAGKVYHPSTPIENNNIDCNEDEDSELASRQLTDLDISYVIDTIKKEAPYDEISIKQLFYGMCSAFTRRPIPHNINSKDPGAGKSYLLTLVAGYFPDKYVIILTGMSDKAIFHGDGIKVIENKETGKAEPIDPIINDLKGQAKEVTMQIDIEKKKDSHLNRQLIKENQKKIEEIEDTIKDIERHAEKLIDLNNQIIICLDTPQDSLFDTLMSLTSQDTPKDQKYSFVEKSSSGKFGTKNNILRGMPVLFTTQVIDDTRRVRFQEKNRRFINITPDTSAEKVGTANDLIGLTYGSLPEEYDELVVSRKDKERVKETVKILVAKLKQHSKHFAPKESGVKIPFLKSVTSSMPCNQVWNMTVTERIMKYLSIITKVNMDSRPRLVNEQTGQFYSISTFGDLKETLKLMERAASGIRPYIATWYNRVFIPAFEELDGKPNEDKDDCGFLIAKEKYVGLTTEQLAEKTKEVFGGQKLGSKELRDKYLYPLINQGVIDQSRSELNRSRNVYFPVEEGAALFSIFDSKGSTNFKLKITNRVLFPSKKLLEDNFRKLSKQDAKEGVVCSEENFFYYKLIDADGSEISIDDLVQKYFSHPEDCFIKEYNEGDETDPIGKKEETDYNTPLDLVRAASTNNTLYALQIIQKNNISAHASGRPVFTKFPNNLLEENSQLQGHQSLEYECHYCSKYHSNIEREYQRHVLRKHPGKMCYPSNADLERPAIEG